MIQNFLEGFYRTISFEAGMPFPGEAFRALFRADALLLERTGEGGYTARTLEEHIGAFEGAIRDHPALFEQGFSERQTDVEWTEQSGVYLVHSGYEKRYARAGVPVVERGTNHFTIIETEDGLLIACVVW